MHIREDTVLPRLDAWLGTVLDPANVDGTVAALAAVDRDNTTRTEVERCERAMADCEQRLVRYRAALEAGTDPPSSRSGRQRSKLNRHERRRELQRAKEAHRPPPTRDELEQLIRDAGDLVTVLDRAEAADRAVLYAALGLRLRYEPDRRRIIVGAARTANVWARVRVGGGI